jgi:hypothetical protein
MQPHKSNGALTLVLSVCIFAVLLSAGLMRVRDRVLTGRNDFVQLYAGATYVQTPHLYDIEEQRKFQISLFGDYFPSVYYTRLPFYALLLRPLAHLPYQTAYVIYQACNFTIIGLFLYCYLKRISNMAPLVAISLPLIINFANGQDAGIAAAIAGFAILLTRKDQEFLAGMLLSLASIKIHLFILVPLVLIMQRRWRILGGGVVGGGILLGLSFVAGGWSWVSEFTAMISNPELHPYRNVMPTYRNLVATVMGNEQLIPELVLSVLTAGLVGYLAWKIKDFELAFAISLIAGLLVCFHAYIPDTLMLMTAFLVVATGKGVSKLFGTSLLIVNTPLVAILLMSGTALSALVPILILTVVLCALVDARRPAIPARLDSLA